MSLGRYLAKNSAGITTNIDPITTAVNNVTRTWNDADGDYVPDCDLALRTRNGECGDVNNFNFGGLTPNTTYADDAIHGYGRRGYNWDFSTEIQRELRPGWSITGGYYRNWFGNFLVTDNTLVTPADFDPYCITAPADARLPGGGGYQVCGLYDIKPEKFGQVNSVVTRAQQFGKQRLINDFFSVSLNARLRSDLQFGAGVDTGRTVNDLCFNVDSPGAAAGNVPAIFSAFTPAVQIPGAAITIDGKEQCRVVTPFSGQTQFKAFGTYLVAQGLRREPDPAEHLGAVNRGDLRRAHRDHRAVAGSQPVRGRSNRHGSVDHPADGLRGPFHSTRFSSRQRDTAEQQSAPAGECRLL